MSGLPFSCSPVPHETVPLSVANPKTYEQVEEEYAKAQKRWEELQADPDSYGLDDFHERLLDFVDAGLCVDMAMRRHFESLDPHAQSEMLKQLAKDENVSASYWFDVLFGN